MDAMISKLYQSLDILFADSGKGFDLGRWLLFCESKAVSPASGLFQSHAPQSYHSSHVNIIEMHGMWSGL